MFDELFEYDELIDESAEQVGFSGVTMKKDFGPLKAGQKIEGSLWFNLEEGYCMVLPEDYDGDDEATPPQVKFKFKLVAA